MKRKIIKGFHIPFHLKEEEIIRLGDVLLGSGEYSWIEIKWPNHYIGKEYESYVRGIQKLVQLYHPGVSCHIPTNLDIGQSNKYMQDAVIHQIKQCIDYAFKFNATILPIHPGTIMTFDPPSTDETDVKKSLRKALVSKKAEAKKLSIQVIQVIADYAKQYDMTIAVENLLLPQEICYTAKELKELVNECNRDNVKALYDCGHAHRVLEDVGEYARILDQSLVHVHLNDNDSTCDLHLQLKEGSIDYDAMFKAFANIQFYGPYVMETSYQSAEELLLSSHILDTYFNQYFKEEEV